MSPIIAALLPVLEVLFKYVWDKYDDSELAWSEVKSSLAGGKITKADLPDLEGDIKRLHELADRTDPGAVLAGYRRNAGGFTAPEPAVEPAPDTLPGAGQ